MKLLGRIKNFSKSLGRQVSVKLTYDEKCIPENGGLRAIVTLERGRIPKVEAIGNMFDRVFIGGHEEFAERFYSDCRSIFTRVASPRKEPMFWLSDLSHAEDREYVETAPGITVSGLDFGADNLMYRPSDFPDDDIVYTNQLAALQGEIDGVKLFAVRCKIWGQIECYFYSEKTQRLSCYILDYERNMPMVLSVKRGLARYLVVYESVGGALPSNYVLQYVDDSGTKMEERTYLSMVVKW